MSGAFVLFTEAYSVRVWPLSTEAHSVGYCFVRNTICLSFKIKNKKTIKKVKKQKAKKINKKKDPPV